MTQLRPVPGNPAAPGPLPASRSKDGIDLWPPPDETGLLTLTIVLSGSDPTIWRRLSLPGDLTLDRVHTLFQAAMGWTDSHLHQFQPGIGRGHDQPHFITDLDEHEGEEGIREDGVRLDQVLRRPQDRLTYRYDLGDGWEHVVTLESLTPLTPLTPDHREPACLDGASACPPEDVGGIPGHLELAAWLRAGAPNDRVPEAFDDAEHARDWLPIGYDPDAFDAARTTASMRACASGGDLSWPGMPPALADLVQGLPAGARRQAHAWLTASGPHHPVVLDEDDVSRAARPWRGVLDAVGSGAKLTAAGYLPPAVVEQIAQAAGVTDWWIGRANREDLTPPVASLRQYAQQLGLLRKTRGTLIPTARGRAVAHDPRELVTAVLQRLPLGKGFGADAGWFLLLGLAAGESGTTLEARIAQLLTARGWRTASGLAVGVSDAHHAARPTLDVLESMAGGRRAVDHGLVTRLARAALLGTTSSSPRHQS